MKEALKIVPKDQLTAAESKAVEKEVHKGEVDSIEAFQLMDKRDEEQIIAELEGRFIDEYVYEYTDKRNNVIRGLSITGVNEAAKDYGGIQCSLEKMKIIDNADDIHIIIEAVDTKTNSSVLGASIQTKKMKTSYGMLKDPFYLQKCLSKAQRNAKKQLLSHELIKKWIDQKKGTAVKIGTTKPQEKKIVNPVEKKVTSKYTELLNTCTEAKKRIGDSVYYGVLKELGYKNASDMKKTEELDAFIAKCREAYKAKK